MLAQSALSGSILTIGAATTLLVVGVVFAVGFDVVLAVVGAADGLTTTTLLGALGLLAATALLVRVLTTVTVRWVVFPELQAATVNAMRNKGPMAVRRIDQP